MPVSQNGWAANDPSLIQSFAVPGGKLALRRGPAGAVLAWVVTQHNFRVEALMWPGCWGFAERPIRGGVQLSNHASGTAADVCAPRHPLGSDPASNYSPAQIAAIHGIVAACHGLIRWGGDYIGRKDGMHYEVNDGVSEAALAALLPTLTGGPAPAPAPIPPPSGLPVLQSGSTGPAVVALQEELARRFPAYSHECGPLPATGNYLTITTCWVEDFQRRSGLVVDGIVGPNTWHALGH